MKWCLSNVRVLSSVVASLLVGMSIGCAETSQTRPAVVTTAAFANAPIPPEILQLVSGDSDQRFANAKGNKDVRSFPARQGEIGAALENVAKGVVRALNRRGDSLSYYDPVRGEAVTAIQRHGLLGFPTYDKFYFYLEEIGPTRTRVTYLYARFYRDMEHEPIWELMLRPEFYAEFHLRVCRKFEGEILSQVAL